MNEYRLTEEEYCRILALKRDLHMYPETAGKEIRTTEKRFFQTIDFTPFFNQTMVAAQ